jgi:hypothetical protein
MKLREYGDCGLLLLRITLTADYSYCGLLLLRITLTADYHRENRRAAGWGRIAGHCRV